MLAFGQCLWRAQKCQSLASMPFYAVRKGRSVGIYSDWDACKEQVNGFKGAQYKKFDSQDAANRFIAGDNSGTGYGRRNHFQQSSAAGNYYGGQNSNSGFHGNGQRSRSQSETYTGHGNQNNSASQNRYHPYSGHSTPRASQGNCDSMESTVSSLRKGISKLASQVKILNQQIDRIEKNKTQRQTAYTEPHHQNIQFARQYSSSSNNTGSPIVYTDGCCTNNGFDGARAGIGVYWGENHPRNVAERLTGRQTNNRAEIHASRKAINQAKQMGYKSLTLKTDSQFVIKSVTQWMPNWKRNGWKTSNGQTVKNKDDFIELDRDMQGIDINWVHVRGHQGEPGNEAADRLANQGAGVST